MVSLADLAKEIEGLKERNKRVEAGKAWETSYTRRVLLFVFTFLAIGIYLRVIGVKDPWLNAIVPAFAFMLSTLTLPFFKNWWLKSIYKK